MPKKYIVLQNRVMTPVSDASLEKQKKKQAERSLKYEKYLKKESFNNSSEEEKTPLKRSP